MRGNLTALELPVQERYVTPAQFAELLGVSVSTVRRWIKAGMPSETWGLRAQRILPSRALAWLRAREYGAGTTQIAPATASTARGHGPEECTS